jgi:hypothetical protein
MEGSMSDDISNLEEHLRNARERWYQRMQGEFDPWNLPLYTPRAEARMVCALEYAAFQLGEINQRLARLTALTEEIHRDRRDGR